MQKIVIGMKLTVDQLTKDFASMRLDLKSARILHDEEYTPPPADELTERKYVKTSKNKKTSKIEKMVEDSDPFA